MGDMIVNIPKKFMTHYLFILDPASLKIVFATKMLNGKGISERNTESSEPSSAMRLWPPCGFQANARNEYSHKMSWNVVVTEERNFI